MPFCLLQSKGRCINLSKSVSESKKEKKEPIVQTVPITELYPFPNHPFKVCSDDSMEATIESIKAYGVLVPAIVRPRKEGGYEIIAGHRRKYACEQAGLETMPVIVRDLDDSEATIIMVDSNLQRENILPSERAQAYKMKLEAIKRQGERGDLTSCQVGTRSRSDEKIAEGTSESARTVQRYIRLTELIPAFQELVDDRKMGLTPACEISFLNPREQELLMVTIESEQAIPSLSQAQRLKKLSQEGKLNEDNMLNIMSETKKDVERIMLSGEVIRKYFPRSYSPKRIEETILKLIETWYRKRQQEHSR
ncbi:MAG: ParB/RepB/Spo0J family partition protein [Christensenellales bacterium]